MLPSSESTNTPASSRQAMRSIRLRFCSFIKTRLLHDGSIVRERDVAAGVFQIARFHGSKIFRHILEYLDEDITALPMRDILNRLERYLIIPSADEWTYIRELRNEISHDYPLLETDVAAILNELFSKTDIIFSIYSKLKSVFNNNRHA